jgi:UPF0755 protein
MRLQSDPTIIYGIAGGKGRLDRALTRTDIETTTAYNTYRINGLPPGPIANPGRAALEAVLMPQPTDYLYFVADGTGGHAFAITLDEHNRNVRQWRKVAGNAAAAAAAEDAGETGDAVEAPAPGAAVETATPPAAQPDGPLADVTPEPDQPQPPVAETATGPVPPKPKLRPARTPAAEAPAPEASAPEAAAPESPAPEPVALEPGMIVTVEGRQAVIPRARPQR